MSMFITSIFQIELLNRYEEGLKLAGIIYTHRISDGQFTGTIGRNFKMFWEICGDTTLKNVVLVTNMWGVVSPEVSEARENELSSDTFKPAIDKGAQTARHYDTAQSAHDVIRRITVSHPVVLQVQRRLTGEHENNTIAVIGEASNRELDERITRYQAELKEVREEMTRTLGEKDEMRKEVEEWMERFGKVSEEMAENHAAEKERMEARVMEVEREARRERQWAETQLANLDHCLQDVTNDSVVSRARSELEVKEREQAEAEHKRQLADLTRQFRDEINASATHRARLEQEMKKLQGHVAAAVTMTPQPIPYVQSSFQAIHNG